MHPGPVNRGVEISPDVMSLPDNIILDQVTNGVAIRMALMYSFYRKVDGMAFLIRNARAIDPSEGLDDTLDILIDDGRIKAMAGLSMRSRARARRLTLQGCW